MRMKTIILDFCDEYPYSDSLHILLTCCDQCKFVELFHIYDYFNHALPSTLNRLLQCKQSIKPVDCVPHAMTIKLSLTSPIRTEYKKWIYIHTKAA